MIGCSFATCRTLGMLASRLLSEVSRLISLIAPFDEGLVDIRVFVKERREALHA